MDTSTGKEAFRSCNLCEAPGAFITALNHHLQTTTDISSDFKCAREKNGQAGTHRKWSWMATTLHPHYEGHSTNQVLALAQFDFYLHLYFPFTKPTVTEVGNLAYLEVGSVSISISFTFCGTEGLKKSCVSNLKKSCNLTSHPGLPIHHFADLVRFPKNPVFWVRSFLSSVLSSVRSSVRLISSLSWA